MRIHYTNGFPNPTCSFVKELIEMVLWSLYKQSLWVHEGREELIFTQFLVCWGIFQSLSHLNPTSVLKADMAVPCIFALRKWKTRGMKLLAQSHMVIGGTRPRSHCPLCCTTQSPRCRQVDCQVGPDGVCIFNNTKCMHVAKKKNNRMN